MYFYRKRIMRGVTTVAMVFQPQLLVAGDSVAAAPLPSLAIADTPTVQTPSDIVLQDNGVLLGRVVDARGQAVPHSPVSLQTGGKEVLRVVSDDMGRFEVPGLKGGVYQVAATGHQGVYRLWAPGTAPPAAAKGLSIVSQPVDVVRGQFGQQHGNPFSAIGQWAAEHPLLTAGALAAAIAIPIVTNNSSSGSSPSTP